MGYLWEVVKTAIWAKYKRRHSSQPSTTDADNDVDVTTKTNDDFVATDAEVNAASNPLGGPPTCRI